MSNEYTVTVKFIRDMDDDKPIIEAAFPNDPTPLALARQLAEELQSAYDEASIDGRFQVVSVEIGGIVHSIDGN